MQWFFHAPVIVKVLGSLALILVLNSACRRLSLSLACGILVLAFWGGHSFTAGLGICWQRFTSLNHILLLLITAQVYWLGTQMSQTGTMRDLVTLVRSHISQRAAVAVLPAVIGSLPMPGGALFSAPLVQDCDRDAGIDPLLKTQINYWFRHVWEYWWPLYPGVLLTLDITKLELWQFTLVGFPLSIVAVFAGARFLLAKIEPSDERSGHLISLVNRRFLHLVTPILVIVAIYAVITIFVPVVAEFSPYLPMIIGVFAAMLLVQKQRPLNRTEWRKLLFTSKVMNLLVLVTLVRIFGGFIEAPLPDGLSLVSRMRTELDRWSIPVSVIIMILPLISGLASGLAIGFVGASFPIVFSLLGQNPPLGTVLATAVLAFGCGYIGLMLSPVHMCLIVTNEYFDTHVTKSIAGLLPPTLVMLIATIAMHLLVRTVTGV